MAFFIKSKGKYYAFNEEDSTIILGEQQNFGVENASYKWDKPKEFIENYKEYKGLKSPKTYKDTFFKWGLKNKNDWQGIKQNIIDYHTNKEQYKYGGKIYKDMLNRSKNKALKSGVKAAKQVSSNIGKTLAKGAGKFIAAPVVAAIDVHDTAMNPKFQNKFDYLNPVKVAHNVTHKTPIVKDVLKVTDKGFEKFGSKSYDLKNEVKSSTNVTNPGNISKTAINIAKNITKK